MNNIRQKHASFKLTRIITDYHITQHPHVLVLGAGAATIIMVCAYILFSYTSTYRIADTQQLLNSPAQQVLGSQGIAYNEVYNMYTQEVASYVASYLSRRIGYLTLLSDNSLSPNDQHEWYSDVQKVISLMLELKVPAVYRDTHLRIVAVLAYEQQLLLSNSLDFEKILPVNNRLNALIKETSWLQN